MGQVADRGLWGGDGAVGELGGDSREWWRVGGGRVGAATGGPWGSVDGSGG